MINEIKDLEISELKDTKFIHPFKLSYKQNGRNKTWEAIRSHNSVAVLLYHTEKNAFLLVKQFRAPVYLNDKTRIKELKKEFEESDYNPKNIEQNLNIITKLWICSIISEKNTIVLMNFNNTFKNLRNQISSKEFQKVYYLFNSACNAALSAKTLSAISLR